MSRLPRSLGMLRSVGMLGKPLSSAVSSDKSVGSAVGTVEADGSDVSVLSVLVVVAVEDVPVATVSAATVFTSADPLTEVPHAAIARMVTAARARAAVTVERDLMFTPADASRVGRWIVAVRRWRAWWL